MGNISKIYKETKDGVILHDGVYIPLAKGNRDYDAILSEVEAGDAEIIMYEGSDEQADDNLAIDVVDARVWRNAALAEADIDLSREQDGMTNYTVGAIREWRVELRDWPTTDSFPLIKPMRGY